MADSLAPTTMVPLSAVDPALIEQLLDRAFGPDRHERTAYKVRAGTEWLPALSFAAIDDEELLVGSIQVYPVALTDEAGRRHPMLMVGPVAVVPERKSEGFGTTLMLAMASSLDPTSALPQVLIGDAPYYGRFGFVAAPTQGWTLTGPYDKARLLVRAPNVAVLPEKGTLGPWIG